MAKVITRLRADEAEVEWCKRLARRLKIGKRGIMDGKERDKWVGILGEVKTIEHFLFDDFELEGRWDDFCPYDFEFAGKKWDVKTSFSERETSLHFLARVLALQINYDVDGYVFTHIYPDGKECIVDVVGYIEKSDFIQKANYVREGQIVSRGKKGFIEVEAGFYKMQYQFLNDIQNFTVQ